MGKGNLCFRKGRKTAAIWLTAAAVLCAAGCGNVSTVDTTEALEGQTVLTEVSDRMEGIPFQNINIVTETEEGSVASAENQTSNLVDEDMAEKIARAAENGEATVILSNVSGKPGDEITVAAMIVNNPGVLGMFADISFDRNILQLKTLENGEAFQDILEMSCSGELAENSSVLWDGLSITEEQIMDGRILKMTFRIAENAPAGTSVIRMFADEEDILDNNLNPLNIIFQDGYVTIME